MKKIILVSATIIVSIVSCNSKRDTLQSQSSKAGNTPEEQFAQEVNKGLKKDTVKKSLPRSSMIAIDSNEIVINYYSPGVRGRLILGGLVPYDQVWVTGAHSATRIDFSRDVLFGNTLVQAGSYAIFTIPGRERWAFILNKNYQQHLTDDYREEENILKIDIQPQVAKDTVQRLTYELKTHGEGTASINISWEKFKLSIPFTVLRSGTNTTGMSTTGKKLTGITTDEKRDPVCYMPVTAGIVDTITYKKKIYGFCSAECKRLFLSNPENYLSRALK